MPRHNIVQRIPQSRAALGTAPDRVIAQRYGVSAAAVCRARQRLHIRPYASHPRTTRRYLELLAQHREGLETLAVAQTLGVSRVGAWGTLGRLARRGLVWSMPVPGRQGKAPLRWSLSTSIHGETA